MVRLVPLCDLGAFAGVARPLLSGSGRFWGLSSLAAVHASCLAGFRASHLLECACLDVASIDDTGFWQSVLGNQVSCPEATNKGPGFNQGPGAAPGGAGI